jgi:PKD repeat protein
MKNYSIIFLMVMSVFSLRAQTADIRQGCLPLEVKFTGPTLSAWYWDFKDGTFSTEQNPTHIFTQSGTFEVVLKEGTSGPEKAKITIRVYEVPTLNIEADPKEGCSPLKVNFSAKITAADSIKINAVQWTFGDGGSSTGFSPTHIYSKGGTYNVSYQVITSLTGCNTTKIFEDLISVFAPKAAFSISPLSQM